MDYEPSFEILCDYCPYCGSACSRYDCPSDLLIEDDEFQAYLDEIPQDPW